MPEHSQIPAKDQDVYQGDITLVWQGTHPAGIDATVIDDIRRSLWGLRAPEELCFHHVFLTANDHGPSVFVWGEEGNLHFQCEYLATTKWTTAREDDGNDD